MDEKKRPRSEFGLIDNRGDNVNRQRFGTYTYRQPGYEKLLQNDDRNENFDIPKKQKLVVPDRMNRGLTGNRIKRNLDALLNNGDSRNRLKNLKHGGRRKLFIQPQDLGWDEGGAEPESYASGYRGVESAFQLNYNINVSNHAIIQTQLHCLILPKDFPKSCGAIKFLDESVDAVLKTCQGMVKGIEDVFPGGDKNDSKPSSCLFDFLMN